MVASELIPKSLWHIKYKRLKTGNSYFLSRTSKHFSPQPHLRKKKKKKKKQKTKNLYIRDLNGFLHIGPISIPVM
jgi:hypothetical protein